MTLPPASPYTPIDIPPSSNNLASGIKALSKSHPVPADDKLERRLHRLERMRRFYDDKAPEAPPKQGEMFLGFVSALLYAITMIKMYRKLTRNLAELAEEGGKDELTQA